MLILHLVDDQFAFTGIETHRLIARGVILDEEDRVALHIIKRQDFHMPRMQVYYETPGGGVDQGETFEEALDRECREEIGYSIDIIDKLGIVHDYYNVVKRENENHYYLARRKEAVGKHFASAGDQLITETIYVPIDEAISLMEGQDPEFISGLVRARELPILREAKRVLEEYKKR